MSPRHLPSLALVVLVAVLVVWTPTSGLPVGRGPNRAAPPSPVAPLGLPSPASGPVGPVAGRLFTVNTSLPDGATNSADGLAIDPTLGVVYASNEFAGTVTAFSERTGSVIAVAEVGIYSAGTYPANLVLDSIHHRLFVSISTRYAGGGGSGWLLVLNQSTLGVEGNVSFVAPPLPPFQPTFLAYDPPSDQVFVENATQGTVAAVNGSRLAVTTYILCPVTGCAWHGYGLLDVPRYHTLVEPTCTTQLWLVDTSNDSTRAILPGPPSTIMAWAAYDSVDDRLWVENYTFTGSQGSFLEYNLTTLVLLANVAGAPARGSAIGYDPSDNALITTDANGSEQISTYDASNASRIASYSVASSTLHPFFAVAFDPTTGWAVASGPGNSSTVAFTVPSLAPAIVYPSFPLVQSAALPVPARGLTLVATVSPTSVRAVNESTGAPLWSVPLPSSVDPVALALSPAGTVAWVLDAVGGALYRIALAPPSVTGPFSIGTGAGVCGLAADPRAPLLYVAESAPSALATFNTSTLTVVASRTVPAGPPCEIAGDPSTGALVTAVPGPTNGTVVGFLGSPLTPVFAHGLAGEPTGIAADGVGRLYVLESGGGSLGVLNSTTGALSATIDLGGFSGSMIALNSASGIAFVGSSIDPSLSLVSVPAARAEGTLGLASPAGGLAVDPGTGTVTVPLASTGQVFAATLVAVPGAPQLLAVNPGNSTVNVSWSPPQTWGPYPVDGYGVTVQPASSANASAALNVTTSPTDVSGLTNGQPYWVRVTAHSYAGWGVDAAVTEATPAGVPYPPTNLTVVAVGESEASVAWSPPREDGGAPIFGYSVQYAADGSIAFSSTPWQTGTNATVPGLAASTGYTFRIVAENSAGTGHPSGSARAVTSTAPLLAPAALALVVLGAVGGLCAVVVAIVVDRRRRSRGSERPSAPREAPPSG